MLFYPLFINSFLKQHIFHIRMVSQEQLSSLKIKAMAIKPFMHIGKNGITDTVLSQIILYLKSNKLGKVKISKSYIDSQELSKKDLAKMIAEKTSSELIHQVGHVIVLFKR